MGQIIGSAAKPKRCNISQLSQLGTPAAGEHILVSSDNSMNAAGQGNFDAYVVGDGTTAATALELKWIADKELAKNSKNAISNSAVFEEVDSINDRISEIVGGEKSVLDYYNVSQGGRITFNPITLSEDGDELYIEALPITANNTMGNGGYGFTFSPTDANKIVVGLCTTYLCVRSNDNTWIWGPNGGMGDSTDYNRKYIRIKFVNGNIEIYGNDGLKTTYTGQKAITIGGIGGSQNVISKLWGGKIWHFAYTHGGVTKELEELDGFTINENVEVVTKSIVIEGELNDIKERLENVEEITEGLTDSQVYVDKVKELGWGTKIKGNSNSVLTCKSPIVLSQNGDSIEINFGAINSESFTSGGYAFTRRNVVTYTGVDGLFVSRTNFAARSDDKTWLIAVADNVPSGSIIRVSYENGNMLFYVDNVLKKTYTGQKTITINSFGDGANHEYGYWAGLINGISVNGTPLSLTNDFVWGTDVELYRADGFLNTEQAEKFSLLLPENVVEASENEVDVYTKINGNKYAGFRIVHTISHTDADYTDYWRISGTGHFYQFDGSNFITGGELLVGAENEFAIKFENTSDFSGGYHGDERIDLDANCYIVFIVDGKEYGISDIIALGRVECGTFSYREKSVIYSEYASTSAHNKWATHVKCTEFKDGGYITRNFVQMEAALTINTAYVGLVCVNKNCADHVMGDDGTVYTGTHPSTPTILVQSLNKASNVAKFWKNSSSCIADSRVVGTNIANWQTPPVSIVIYDRVGDLKYYNMLPQNVAVTASSFFMFECSARFELFSE